MYNIVLSSINVFGHAETEISDDITVLGDVATYRTPGYTINGTVAGFNVTVFSSTTSNIATVSSLSYWIILPAPSISAVPSAAKINTSDIIIANLVCFLLFIIALSLSLRAFFSSYMVVERTT